MRQVREHLMPITRGVGFPGSPGAPALPPGPAPATDTSPPVRGGPTGHPLLPVPAAMGTTEGRAPALCPGEERPGAPALWAPPSRIGAATGTDHPSASGHGRRPPHHAAVPTSCHCCHSLSGCPHTRQGPSSLLLAGPQLVQQVWSRPGEGLAEPRALGSPSPGRGSVLGLCLAVWVPCTPLCLLGLGPAGSLGQLIPTSGPEQGTAGGLLSDSGPKSEWDMETQGQGWGGSGCPSRGVMTASTATQPRQARWGHGHRWLLGTAAQEFPLPQAQAGLDVLNCPKVGVPEPGATCRRDCGQEPDTDRSHSGSTLGVRKLQRTRT